MNEATTQSIEDQQSDNQVLRSWMLTEETIEHQGIEQRPPKIYGDYKKDQAQTTGCRQTNGYGI